MMFFIEVKYDDVQQIGDDVIEVFIQGEYSLVYLIYNQFVLVFIQMLMVEQVLFFFLDFFEGEEEMVGVDVVDYFYELFLELIFDVLLLCFVIFQFYKVFFELQVVEYGVCMIVMDNVMKNVSEFIESFMLVYNCLCQVVIIIEFIEVVFGVNVFDG